MLTAETIRRLHRHALSTRRPSRQPIAGSERARTRGRGLSFVEVRAYEPGDELRTIDWNVTARLGSPHVKVFAEERELSVAILLDVSASGNFGSVDRAKVEVAAEFTAELALSAGFAGHRVSFAAFTDRLECFVPPRRGRRATSQIMRQLLTLRPRGRGTRLEAGLEALQRVRPAPDLVFVVSDFLAEGYRDALARAARRSEVVPVVLRDAVEQQLPQRGIVRVEDPETGAVGVLDAGDARVRAFHQAWLRVERKEREDAFRALGLQPLHLSAGDDNSREVRRFFERRRRHAR